MSVLVIQFLPQPDTDADADQMAANFTSIMATVNGNLEMGTNVRAGPPQALTGGTGDEGGSLLGARSDHTHVVRGFETLAADPTGGNFIGRKYVNTATLKERMCINAAGSGTWITTGNIDASDLPIHGIRHADGGGDPLPTNSLSDNMRRPRTIYSGVPSADVVVSGGAWTDIVTGVAVTIAGTGQTGFVYINALPQNVSGSNSPTLAFRVIDQTSAVIFQTGTYQYSAAGANNDTQHVSAMIPVQFTTSPTLKLQMAANLSGVTVRKSQTFQSSTFAVTSLSVVVG